MTTIPNRQVVFYMELKEFCAGALSLKEINAPIYANVKVEELDELTAGKIFLTAQTLMLTKAAIRERIAGAMDNYEISDNKLIHNKPIRIHGDTFSAGTLVEACLNNNKTLIAGFSEFIKDVIIMSKLATELESINSVNCKFTREVLRLLNTRSDVSIFRELKFDDNLYVYFLNREYMVLTNRGLIAPTSKTEMITPSTTQEFFVTVFKLGSVLESYMSTQGFRGSKVKALQFGKLETYESTMREKNVETNMVFNSCIGPQGWVHWFFNDGFTKRKDRLVVNFIKADPHCNFSLNDIEWQRLKVHFGIPEFNGYLFKHFKSQKELKNGGKNPKTVDC